MPKFNVGDIVIGNDLAEQMYSITCKGTLWEVLRIGVDYISVGNTEEGEYNSLEPKAFDLYKPTGYKFKQGDKVKIAPNVRKGKHYEEITLLDGMLFDGVREISTAVPAGYYVEGFCYSGAMLIPEHPVTSSQDTSSPRFCTGDTATLTDCNGNSIKVVITQGLNEKGCFIKQVSDEIEIGDKVIVTDVDLSYKTSLLWFNEIVEACGFSEEVASEYKFKFNYNQEPKDGLEYRVVGKSTDKRTSRSQPTIYLIIRDNRTYIIGEEGVKKVNG